MIKVKRDFLSLDNACSFVILPMMSLIRKIRDAIVKSYRIIISYDMPVIYHMAINRLKYRHPSDFLIADRPYKFQFIRRHYGHLIEKCRQNPISNKPNEGPIWVFWWQGEAQMPKVVRICYASLKKNAPEGRQIVLVHQDNYRDFVDIPEYIIDKMRKGAISLTHFSDVLRMALLARHGGLWVDSTVYVSNKIPDSIFSHSYFSANEPFNPNSVYRSEYTMYLLGAAAGAPWIVYTRDVWYEYWKKAWKIIDYAQTNYIQTLALDSIPELRDEVMRGVINTPHINTIQNKRNERCSSDIFEKMMAECQFYKLSYKVDFKEQDEAGNLTYYGMLLQHSKQVQNNK